MEVTESERSQMEAADRKWWRPPQSFVDEWNAVCGNYGKFNEDTGFFELNGLTDITYQQAVNIVSYGRDIQAYKFVTGVWGMPKIRTNLPNSMYESCHIDNLSYLFTNQTEMEVAFVLDNSQYGNYYLSSLKWGRAFSNMPKLRKIIGRIVITQNADCALMFYQTENIEEMRLVSYRNLDISNLKKLNFESLRYLVSNSGNGTSPITITLHLDVYARLTEELIATAADRNITLASA